jgi:hypothetical protein
MRIGASERAKIFEVFEGNILGRFSISNFPLFRGDVLIRVGAIYSLRKEKREGNPLSPHDWLAAGSKFTD